MSAEQSLVDDLADVLSHMVVGWYRQTGIDLAEHPDVLRVMERYRESKVPCEAYVAHGPGRQSRTKCEVRGPHQFHYAHDPMSPAWEWETRFAYADDFGGLREVPDEA